MRPHNERLSDILRYAAFLLPLISFAAAHLFFSPSYQTNDDPGMDLYARGLVFSSAPTPFLLVSNVIYGELLCSLYRVAPAIPWYRALQITLQLGAGLVFVWAVLRIRISPARVLLLLLYFLVFDLAAYVRIQVTITAALVAQAGIALWYTASCAGLGSRRTVRILGAAGIVAVAVAALVRHESALLMLAAGLPGLAYLWWNKDASRTRPLRAAAAPAALVLVTLLLVAGLRSYDTQRYESDSHWRGFRAIYAALVEYVDYGKATYTPATKHIFDDVGWSRTDFLMLMTHFFADEERFSLTKMRQVLDGFSERPFTLRGKSRYLDELKQDPDRWLLLAAVLVPALYWSRRRGMAWSGAATLLVAVALGAYLVFGLQRLPQRTYFPIFAIAACIATLLADADPLPTPRPARSWSRRAGVALLVVLLCFSLARWDRESRSRAAVRSGLEAAMTALAPGNDELYVLWGPMPYEFVAPLGDYRAWKQFKVFSVGSDVRAPLNRERLAEFGIDDIHRAIYERDDVFMISTMPQNRLFAEYAREHYGATVDFSPRKSFHPLFTVYDFRRIDSR